MSLTVKLSGVPGLYIVTDSGRETVISAASEQEAIEKYQTPVFESDEQKLAARWDVIRYKRDQLIAETDYTQVADSPLSPEKKAEFTAYRQALRDIPQTYSDPDAVVWPEKPTI